MRPLLAAAVLLSVFACRQGEQEVVGGSPVVARSDAFAIRVADVANDQMLDVDERRRRVERAVHALLLAQEAARRGLGATPTAVTGKQVDALRHALVRAIGDEVQISDEHARAHYERTRAQYAVPMVRLRRWPTASRAAAESLLHASEPPAGKAEEVGPLPLQRLPSELRSAAARMEAFGDRLIAGSDEAGWWTVELVERLTAATPSFEEVREDVVERLRMRLVQEEMRELSGKLRAATPVEIDEDVLVDDRWWSAPRPEGAP